MDTIKFYQQYNAVDNCYEIMLINHDTEKASGFRLQPEGPDMVGLVDWLNAQVKEAKK